MKQTPKKFKDYEMNQPVLLPQDISERIPERHMVRIVNSCIDQMDLKALEDSYKGGGTKSYHPRMLLKVMVYAYLYN